MTEPICTKELFASRGLQSPCKCPRCKADLADALAYYREDLCPGPVQSEEFPEKE